MTMPNARQLRGAAKNSVLTPLEVQSLYNVLLMLGFDYGFIGMFWDDQPPEEVEQRFKRGLTGEDLAFFCRLVAIHPGVIQGKLNFDESKVGTKKVGFRSTPAPLAPTKPPELCLYGSTADGRAFRLVYESTAGIPEQSRCEPHILAQIAGGKRPVRLQQLRDVVEAAERGCDQQKSLQRLKDILNAFPKDIRTIEQIFALAEETTLKEGQEMNESDRVFSEQFRKAGLGAVFARLVDSLKAYRFVEETLGIGDDDLAQIQDGDAGLKPEELHAFLEHVNKTYKPIGDNAARQKELKDFYEEQAPEDAPELRVQNGAHVAPKAVSDAASGDQGREGLYGEIWFDDRVELGGRSLKLVGDGQDVLAKRVFSVLEVLLDELDDCSTWPALCRKLTIDYQGHVKPLEMGELKLDSMAVNALLMKLKLVLPQPITIEQLFGFTELPKFGKVGVVEVPDDVASAAETVNSSGVVDEELSEDDAEDVGEGLVDDDAGPDLRPQTKAVMSVGDDDIAIFKGANQRAIAEYIKAFVAASDILAMSDVLHDAGIGNHMYNSQVLKGKKAYSLQQLKRLAQVLGLTLEELVKADVSTITRTVVSTSSAVHAAPDVVMQTVARTIAHLVAKSDGRFKLYPLLQAVGIKYRPHNSMVEQGKPGYTYTNEQLEGVAKILGVTVDMLKGEVSSSAEEKTTAAPEKVAPGVSTPEELGQQVLRDVTPVAAPPQVKVYDQTDKELRKVVVAQMRKLLLHLNAISEEYVSQAKFVQGVSGIAVSVFTGNVQIGDYALRWLVDKYQGKCPWLTVKWLLADNEVPKAEHEDAAQSIKPEAAQTHLPEVVPSTELTIPVGEVGEGEPAPEVLESAPEQTELVVAEGMQPEETAPVQFPRSVESMYSARQLVLALAEKGMVDTLVLVELLRNATGTSDSVPDEVWRRELKKVLPGLFRCS